MLERFILGASLVAACSPAPAPVSRSANDPSNPDAPAGRDPITASVDGHEHSDGAATVYACPMHPEVTSDKRDQVCPKCGMKLVPKKP